MRETTYDLEDSVEITAPPAAVWALVSDVRRMHEWSPQVTSTRVKPDDSADVELGTDFTNRNMHGEVEWTTHATITRCEPEQALAFRIAENWVVWSFLLEPTGAGTRLTQRREAPDGISPMSLEWAEKYLDGQTAFTATMKAGMHETLEAIKAALES